MIGRLLLTMTLALGLSGCVLDANLRIDSRRPSQTLVSTPAVPAVVTTNGTVVATQPAVGTTALSTMSNNAAEGVEVQSSDGRQMVVDEQGRTFVCKAYVMPDVPLLPTPPVITDKQSEDSDYLNVVMLSFIEEYRTAVVERERIRRTSYEDYLRSCKLIPHQSIESKEIP